MEPTAVVVPLREMLASDEHWELATTELFGPFQVPGRGLGLIATLTLTLTSTLSQP